MKELLTFHDVDYSYHSMQGETHAIDHMSFTVYNQEFLVIVGPSGCGKSTLLDLIAGQIHPQKGQITGVNDSIGYMLQKDHLFEWRTIEKNILLGLEIQKKKNRENLELANALLKKYDLYDFDPGYEIISEMREEALAAKERKYNEKKELEKARRKHYASIIGTMTGLAIKNGLYF